MNNYKVIEVGKYRDGINKFLDDEIEKALMGKSKEELDDLKATIQLVQTIFRVFLLLGVAVLIIVAYLEVMGLEVHITDKGACCYECINSTSYFLMP